ncbi:immunoglobulin domain-containing protein, partial [Marivirga sp.]|uniref:immunoglobulin domain-containing protein n=1 Tax=Marivirga sp. TaxID=2018662 RepID=UPI003DA75CF4
MGLKSYGQVTITEAELKNFCTSGGSYTLPDIVITESNPDDIENTSGTTEYYRIQLPTNFEFSTTGTVNVNAFGGDISNSSSVTNGLNFIRLNLVTQGTSELNTITFTGYQVTTSATTFTTGDITREDSPAGTDIIINGSVFGTKHGSLTKETAPNITSQPTSTVICENDNTSFSITAEGGSFSYQWERDAGLGAGFESIDGTLGDDVTYSNFNSPTLQLSSAGVNLDGYTYRAVVTGACLPTATSNEVTITVNPLPVITTQPTSVERCSGQSASFSVAATGTTLSYQWYRNGVAIDGTLDGSVYTNFTTSTLNISDVTGLSGNDYQVIVTESSNTPNCPVSSNTAILTVNPLPDNSLTVTPDVTEVCDGETLDFTISSSQPGVNYQLFDETNTAFSNAVVGNGGIISITSDAFNLATYTDGSETITVKATNGSSGCVNDLTDTETITIYEPPTTADAGTDQENCGSGNFTLAANMPSVGTGNWTVESGTATIDSPNLNNSTVSGVPAGSSAVLRWTISNGACADSFDEVTLTNYETPPTANAGADIDQCNNSTFTMAANSAGSGTGTWTEVTATGVTITNINSPTTTVTGLTAGSSATLRWTISNGSCTPTSDDVIITNDLVPTASAGSDAEICVTNGSYTFSGTTSSNGTIAWTTSGTGGFNDATIDNPTYTPSTDDNTAGSVTLTKTVTTAFGICADASDDMVLTITPTPPTANAGADIEQCNNSTFTMAANSAGSGTGTWTEVTATGVTITNINSPTTTVTGLTAGSSATLRWTISNGSCTPTSDDVIITNDLVPTASAGSDAEICVTNGSYTFSGTTSSNGTIAWTTSGDGTFSSTTAENPTYTPGTTDNSTGSVTLTKTVTTAFGICADASDDMVLTITPTPPTANAGADIEQCNNSTFTMAANSAGSGTGTWTEVTATGVTITNINSPTTTVT